MVSQCLPEKKSLLGFVREIVCLRTLDQDRRGQEGRGRSEADRRPQGAAIGDIPSFPQPRTSHEAHADLTSSNSVSLTSDHCAKGPLLSIHPLSHDIITGLTSIC